MASPPANSGMGGGVTSGSGADGKVGLGGWLFNLTTGGGKENATENNTSCPNKKLQNELEAIERCNNVQQLLDGIDSDLKILFIDNEEGDCGKVDAGEEAPPLPPPPPPSSRSTSETSTTSTSPQMATLAHRLNRLKSLLYDDKTPSYTQTQTVVSTLSSQHTTLIPTLLRHLCCLPFETRKDTSSIVCFLLCCSGSRSSSFSKYHHHRSEEEEKTISQEFAMYIQTQYESIMNPIVYGYYCGAPTTTTTTTTTNIPPYVKTTTPKPDVALHCGTMLRSTLRHPTLYQLFLSEEYTPKYVYPFLDVFVHLPNFDVASDAIESLRVILTGVPSSSNAGGGGAGTGGGGGEEEGVGEEDAEIMAKMASEFLEREYESVLIERFNRKLLSKPKEVVVSNAAAPAVTSNNAAAAVGSGSNASNTTKIRNPSPPPPQTPTPTTTTTTTTTPKGNYITRRMSLQLLTTILLTRINYNVMIKYISSRSNLVLVMLLLRDPSPHITLDAFHVFKIFVANPAKPPEVVKILVDNKVKLCKYLGGLHREREGGDEQFRDEKALVIATIEGLEIESG